jgi:transposase
MGITVPPKQREDVQRQRRRPDLTRRVRERLEMVKAAALGDDVERIVRWSGRSVETVEHWLARFAAGGVAALSDAPRSGRPVQADLCKPTRASRRVQADAAYLAAMETALETPPAQLGLAFDVWTSERLSLYLEQQTGVHSSPGWRRALLSERGWVCGRPKHTLKHLQDPAAVAASRAELAAVGENGASGSGALRAAFPGRDASGDQSLPGSRLASQGQTGDATRRRDQSARHGVWQRRSVGTRAGGAGARGAGQRRVRALPGALGGPSPRRAAGDLSGAR